MSLLVSVILVAAILWSASLTRGMMLTDRRALLVARVLPSDEHPHIMLLEIRNIGRGLAHDIEAAFTPDVVLPSGLHINLVLGRISLLQPGEAIPTVLFDSRDRADMLAKFGEQAVLGCDFSWLDESSRQRRRHVFHIRVDQRVGLAIVNRDGDIVTTGRARDAE